MSNSEDSEVPSIAAAVSSNPDVSSGLSSTVAESDIILWDRLSPSVIRAMDNMFKAINNSDRYHSLESMI